MKNVFMSSCAHYLCALRPIRVRLLRSTPQRSAILRPLSAIRSSPITFQYWKPTINWSKKIHHHSGTCYVWKELVPLNLEISTAPHAEGEAGTDPSVIIMARGWGAFCWRTTVRNKCSSSIWSTEWSSSPPDKWWSLRVHIEETTSIGNLELSW